jgi:hypothetical protein
VIDDGLGALEIGAAAAAIVELVRDERGVQGDRRGADDDRPSQS